VENFKCPGNFLEVWFVSHRKAQMDREASSKTVFEVFPPSSDAPQLSRASFPYTSFTGKWFVVASTLPLWRDKKNVTITYTPVQGEPETTLDDLVEYHNNINDNGAKSSITGVDKLEKKPNGACWKWRGKGLLFIASSVWQVLGYGKLSNTSVGIDWAVTYFEETIFTPCGLDIYSRDPHKISRDALQDIISAVKAVPEVLQLANNFFEVRQD